MAGLLAVLFCGTTGVTFGEEPAAPAAAEATAPETTPAPETAAPEEDPLANFDFYGDVSPATPAQLAAEEYADGAMFRTNNTWMLIAAAFVFLMHLGFATLESGLVRSKNVVNILFKNTAIVAIGLITYGIIGFNMMYPGTYWDADANNGEGAKAADATWNGYMNIPTGATFGATPPGFRWKQVKQEDGRMKWEKVSDASFSDTGEIYNEGYTYWTDFIFQAMFAATAATIVSGAVAERIKLPSFLVFSAIYVAVIYPIVGSWQWGGGFLNVAEFYDFAGCTLVHSVGGWGALAGAIILGPRAGKYVNGTIRPIMGHSLPLAAIGVFLLWFGWFGFNGGSVLSADPNLVSLVFTTTSFGAAAGILGAMLTSWIVQSKPDLTMALNGCLAGLVGVTAGADSFTVLGATIIGLIAGVIVVFSVLGVDKMKIDDPVGAISVHLVCGIWGTLAVALFSDAAPLGAQIMGVVAAGVVCFPSALVLFLVIKAVMGLRVSPEEETKGLDLGEHAQESYAGFQIWTVQ
jgi:Amt family ammonium transporter